MDDLESSISGNISPKFLPGIDALYFQVKVNFDNYTQFYNNILLKDVLTNDSSLECLSDINNPKQYLYYRFYSQGGSPLEICRIGFKNLNTRDNLESIMIQMNTIALNLFGYKQSYSLVIDKLAEMGLEALNTKISRVDLNTYVTGHNFEYLDFSLFSTKMKKSGEHWKVLGKLGIKETFYLGSRDSKSILLRIYNKKQELLSIDDYSTQSRKELLIIERFKNKYPDFNFNNEDDIWNVEFEIKRDMLRQYKINTVDDLFTNINGLHNDIMVNRIRLLERSKDNINNTRISSSDIWKQIDLHYKIFTDNMKPISREKIKVYKKDNVWLKNRLDEFLNEKSNNDEEVNHLIKNLQNFL